MDKLRIVVDASLEGGAIAAQAVHALTAFVVDHPEAFAAWRTGSNTVAILAAPAAQLHGLKACAELRGLATSSFHEPDLGDALTGVALGPSKEARRLTREFRRAGSARRTEDAPPRPDRPAAPVTI